MDLLTILVGALILIVLYFAIIKNNIPATHKADNENIEKCRNVEKELLQNIQDEKGRIKEYSKDSAYYHEWVKDARKMLKKHKN